MKAYKKIRFAQSQLHSAQLTVTAIEALTTGATREQREHYALLAMIRKLQGGYAAEGPEDPTSEAVSNQVGEAEQGVLRDLIATVYSVNDTLTNFEGVETYIRGGETHIIQEPVTDVKGEQPSTDVEIIPPNQNDN